MQKPLIQDLTPKGEASIDILIGRPDDPRIADYRDLSDGELFRGRGAFIAEGRLVVRRLLTESPYATRSVLVTPAARHALHDVLDDRPDLPVYVCPPAFVQLLTGFNLHRGCLALGERPPAMSADVLAARAGDTPAARLLALEGVANADNVGGLVRTAAAFGVSGVFLGPGCCDPLYRKAIRTSMGAALTMPFALDDAWPDVLDRLRAAGWQVLALTPGPAADPIDSFLPQPERPTVLLLGSEGEGLTDRALARADRCLRIPMIPGVDSLNIVVAAGIALHWITRIQR